MARSLGAQAAPPAPAEPAAAHGRPAGRPGRTPDDRDPQTLSRAVDRLVESQGLDHRRQRAHPAGPLGAAGRRRSLAEHSRPEAYADAVLPSAPTRPPGRPSCGRWPRSWWRCSTSSSASNRDAWSRCSARTRRRGRTAGGRSATAAAPRHVRLTARAVYGGARSCPPREGASVEHRRVVDGRVAPLPDVGRRRDPALAYDARLLDRPARPRPRHPAGGGGCFPRS